MKKTTGILLGFIILLLLLTGCTPAKNGFTKDDLIYFILTDRFSDGDDTNNYDVDKTDPRKRHGGDIKGIIDKLDYIKDLGATAIWITPVMKNEKDGYHGYWIEDFYEVDPHLGSMEDMKNLVKESHEKDIKVILDYVVNHTGYNSPWLKDEKYKDWFNENKTITNWNDQEQVENGWLMGLPDLDLSNPEVKNYFIENALWWIDETGIDGMRLDTVKHVPRSFWTEFVSAIKDKHPDFYFLGEVWSENPRYFKSYSETGIDAFTNYPLYKGIINTFFEYGNTKHIKKAIREDSSFERPELNGIFIDNHDNTRFISKHKVNGEEYLKQALAFTMTYPAIPVIYYGTEIGMEGLEDPDNRQDMDWDKVNSSELLDFYKALINIRNTKAIKNGEFILLDSNNYYLAYLLDSKDEYILVIMNIQDKEMDVEILLDDKTGKLKSQLDDRDFEIIDEKLQLNLKPLDLLILKGK
jgi:alpha-amylase